MIYPILNCTAKTAAFIPLFSEVDISLKYKGPIEFMDPKDYFIKNT